NCPIGVPGQASAPAIDPTVLSASLLADVWVGDVGELSRVRRPAVDVGGALATRQPESFARGGPVGDIDDDDRHVVVRGVALRAGRELQVDGGGPVRGEVREPV